MNEIALTMAPYTWLNQESKLRGFAPLTDEHSWLLRKVFELANKPALITDTLADMCYERAPNPEPGRPQAPEVFFRRPVADFTYNELERALELETLREKHYARIADALLEG
jgi:hypothetical protein